MQTKTKNLANIGKLLWDAVQGKEKNFTTGSINRALILLSVPMILEMVMESLFAVVDAFFVSRVGTEAVATVGLTETVVTIVYALAIGISMGATAMVARRVGENDKEAAAVAAMQAIILSAVISIIISILGIIFASDILRLMGASEGVIEIGSTYTSIILGSNIVITFLFLLNGIFRGAGDAYLAMRALWIANILNIFLDPMLILGIGPFPELGLTGAAVATTIGRGVGVLYQLYILFSGKTIVRLLRRHIRVDLVIIRRLVKVAANGAFQFMIASLSWMFMMRIIAEFGDEAIAGYTFAIRLIVFTILPAWGLSNAAATLVGQNLGAEKPDRAEASVWRAGFFNMIFLLFVSIVFFAFAHQLIGIFTQDPEVLKAGVLSLRIICVGYVFFSYGMVIGQSFNGAGDTFTPMVVNIICFWLIQIPLGYFMGKHLNLGVVGVCWAIVVSETILAVIMITLFRRGKWKEVSI
ncbi:MAG: MATE family efflux transporter [Bacteroidota bacterium]